MNTYIPTMTIEEYVVTFKCFQIKPDFWVIKADDCISIDIAYVVGFGKTLSAAKNSWRKAYHKRLKEIQPLYINLEEISYYGHKVQIVQDAFGFFVAASDASVVWDENRDSALTRLREKLYQKRFQSWLQTVIKL